MFTYSPAWEDVWGENVPAVLTDNVASEFEHTVSYSCDEVNKEEEDVWLVYLGRTWLLMIEKQYIFLTQVFRAMYDNAQELQKKIVPEFLAREKLIKVL